MMKITKALVDSDFDGVVCGALLSIIFPGIEIRLSEASTLQAGRDKDFVDENTVVADLSFVPGCGLYFDHHHTNKPEGHIVGSWKPLNSAAEVIYEYYKEQVDLARFEDLIVQLGRFDSGLSTLEDMQNMGDYLLMGFTIERQDKDFSIKLIKALAENDWEDVLKLDFVRIKMDKCREDINSYYGYISKKVEIKDGIAFIDNRDFQGNMAHAYFIAARYPDVDAIIMLRQANDEFRVTMFWNNFKQNGYRYDLLGVAKKLNPQISGGHKGACGATVRAELGFENVKRDILAKLKQQKG